MSFVSKFLRSSAIVLISTTGLSACGGSSGGGGTPPPPPPPPPSNNAPTLTTNPTNLVFPENQQVSFTVEVDDADGDTVTVTIGNSADGAFFTLNTSNGIVTSTKSFDFENPEDANADNVYEQTITLDDGTDSVTQTVNVTIENVPEPVVISGSSFKQSDNFVFLGSIDDVDQDGIDDILFSNGGTFGDDISYGILSGAEYDTLLTNGGTLDENTPTLTNFDFGNVGSGNFNFDVLAAPDGSGTDLLFSDGSRGLIYEYRVRTAADRQSLLGTVDLTAPADNRIEYSFTFDPDDFFAGRQSFVGDVDGDGINDLLTEYYESSGQNDPIVGLVFGKPITDNASRSVIVSEDVTFTTMAGLDVGVTGSALKDMDSDGGSEVVITSNELTCIVYSDYLTEATLKTVVLDQLDDANGTCFTDVVKPERILNFDHDADGSDILIMRDHPFELVMDIDDFRSLPSAVDKAALTTNGAKLIATELSSFDDSARHGFNDITQIPDLTGDGVPDYIAANNLAASGIIMTPFYFFESSVLTDALNSTDSTILADEAAIVPIDLPSFSFSFARVLNLTDDYIVFAGSNNRISLKLEDLRTALESLDGGGIIIQTP